jgi:hypothetical protein
MGDEVAATARNRNQPTDKETGKAKAAALRAMLAAKG